MRALSRGQRLLLLAGAVWLLGLGGVAALLERDAPGPRAQVVQGVGIGRYDGSGGVAYVSGKRLACAPTDRAPYTARCTVGVAGRELELYARRNPPGDPNQLGGVCEAVYAGRTWPCRIGMHHLVPWYAVLDEPLGLTPAGLDAVRRVHPLPNLPERIYIVGCFAVAGLTALGVGGAVAVWWGPLAAPAVRAARVWAVAGGAAAAPVVFVVILLLAARATGGYWD